MKKWVRVVVWRHTPLSNMNWQKLLLHLITSLLIVTGTTGSNRGDMRSALETWFWGFIIYAGGYMQVGEKEEK